MPTVPGALDSTASRARGSLVLTAAVILAGVGTATGTASPHSAAVASNVVTDGNARFEVLTPTLIRLEYAGDGRWQDGTTFNVPTRNLPVPAFTTSVANGYREIHTSGLTLRY